MDLKIGFITIYNFKLFVAILVLLLINSFLLKLKRFIGRIILKLEKKGIL